MSHTKKSTIVIAGAGYAGLAAAQTLAREKNANVVLINKHDYHLLQFQLPEAAVDKIEPDTLALPIRSLVPAPVQFIQAQIAGFDFKARSVHTDRGDIPYNRLIIALGSQPATFDIPGLTEHALMLKSLSHVRSIRGHLEMTFSALKSTTRSTPYPIVIGGAGITGVELAAELAESLKDFERRFDLKRHTLKVILIEAAASVLPGFDRKTIDEATRVLRKLNIEVRTNTTLERVEADRLWVKVVGSDQLAEIRTSSVIWTGGVRANSLVLNSGLTLGERGAAIVDEHLRSIDYAEVFVVGDNAVVRHPRTKEVAIPCGQLAMQQGAHAARQISAELRGKNEPPYVPHLDGLLISLGSYAGVGTVGPIWVRQALARSMKIGAETRYLYNVGGLPLVLARGLLLRHEFVALTRLLQGKHAPVHVTRTSRKGQGDAVA